MNAILSMLYRFSRWDRGPYCLGVYYSPDVPLHERARGQAACVGGLRRPDNWAARLIVRLA